MKKESALSAKEGESLTSKKARLLARCQRREAERRACSAHTPSSPHPSGSSVHSSVDTEEQRLIKMEVRRLKREQIFQVGFSVGKN